MCGKTLLVWGVGGLFLGVVNILGDILVRHSHNYSLPDVLHVLEYRRYSFLVIQNDHRCIQLVCSSVWSIFWGISWFAAHTTILSQMPSMF